MMKKADIAVVGMAVMGENLAMNMEEKGFRVTVFDVRDGVVNAFMDGNGKGRNFTGAYSWKELVESLERPRRIMLMIRAGSPVDEVIDTLLPLLEEGDILIDGGNSFYQDTQRRYRALKEKGIRFIGTGVSGGEEGARKGPSLMPGGDPEAWPYVKPVFTKICAQTDGEPCCDWVGEGGAGHFVKMVHNGIEYGDMELICEVYSLMKNCLHMEDEEIGKIFGEWNRGVLDSYLVEITADILQYRDEDGEPLVEKILDSAGQKGTGKWASQAALDEGVPLTLISEAVYARYISAMKKERTEASRRLAGPSPAAGCSREEMLPALHDALYAAKICSYAQGFSLLRAAAAGYGWELSYGSIALMWRGGCIIRSVFLGKIKEAFDRDNSLTNLLLDPYFCDAFQGAQAGLRKVCARAVEAGIPIPALSAAVAYYDSYRSERLPANLLQAQRDYFGAHTYERVDDPSGRHYHTNWTGTGGDTESSIYTA
ncbi:decarboxylating NADP(+)-dependent phosphogluconate dehydrogenase [Mordavella massiliensis]|uniref:6-phosphogluconate dehydrogenase, decarboxylating n=2 Tax=Mordavella massiliensis TaxID=1871024 RepID=A0A938X869_9CLOT|nr:decarboxylating NADP(+)-dependent phosphogluconate dehydrogenase [Mordavella massiliensis]